MPQPRILLTTLNAKYIHMNLAIRLLYELYGKDERLSWKEFTIKEDLDQIAQYCSEFDIVCFSCYIWNITPTLQVAEKIKALNPETKILLGGPEVSYEWQPVMALPYIDFIITGEGEIPFGRFLEQYPDVGTIPNIASKKEKAVFHFNLATNFELESYAHTNPYRHDDPETLKNRVLYIETSRGCPYKCEFCLASLDNRVRYLPMDHIKSNLLYLMEHGRVIKFLDRTFNVKKDFTLDIFQFILDHARPGNVFQFEITADILHPAIMQFIIDKVPKGMFRFEIGIQTVNQKANLEVSRKQNFEKTKEVILKLKDHVEMHLDLIVGLPLDYWADIRNSFNEVFRLYPPELQLGFLKFLKGTPVREKYLEHGFVFDEKAPYQIIRSNYLSEEELENIVKLEHALEIYWNKKRLVNTLRYIAARYDAFGFLEALGQFFEQHSSFFSYTLKDIYQIAGQFIAEKYHGDPHLTTLVAIDYYLQHKVKPVTFAIEEIGKKDKFTLLEKMGLPHNKFRYTVIPIGFDYAEFQETGLMMDQPQLLIIEYTGTDKPRVIEQRYSYS